MIKVGIVGISGYTGGTLLELLLDHPQVHLSYVSANNTVGPVEKIWPQLAGRCKLYCGKFDLAKAARLCDILFLAVPHTLSIQLTPKIIKKGIKVIDLSGDYRLKSTALYKKWYGTKHTDAANLKKSVYGLPELYRAKVKTAKLVSNPGCYPTAAVLGTAPLMGLRSKSVESIIIDAKSGVSGAGKKLSSGLMYCEVNEDFKAYKVLHHQHTPEIDQTLSLIAGKKVGVTFVPHLLPVNRGILETIYIRLKKKMSLSEVRTLYKKFYKTEPFVRVLPKGEQPRLKNVNYTNFCDLGIAVSSDGQTVVVTSAIDNLVKGAAGQAVQNMNIMCDIAEGTGLK